MNMKAFERPFFKAALCAAALAGMAAGVFAQEKTIIIPPPPRPIPPPVFRPVDLRTDEKPVEVASTNDVVADDVLPPLKRTYLGEREPILGDAFLPDVPERLLLAEDVAVGLNPVK